MYNGGSDDINSSTIKLCSMWESVYTWMKTAVDYVGSSNSDASPVKKCRLQENQDILQHSQHSLPTNIRSDESNLSNQEASKICTTRSILISAEKYKEENIGLNGLLMGAPPVTAKQTVRVKRSNLIKDLKTPKFGKILDSVKENEQMPFAPPLPPPPPPPLPPPPPPIGSSSRTPEIPSRNTRSHNALLQMSNRLRTRMMKKTESSPVSKTSTVNFKTQQWLEIQARKRKISITDFLAQAKIKQQEIYRILEELKASSPGTMDELIVIVEKLQEASLWFAGGYREMKEEIALYQVLEKKIELMNECALIQGDMTSTVNDLSPVYDRPYGTDVYAYLDILKDSFNHKHKQWGHVLQSNAETWISSSLPVDMELLSSARQYLASIVVKLAQLLVATSKKFYDTLRLNNVQKLKDNLKEGLNIIISYHNIAASTSPQCSSSTECCNLLCNHCILRPVTDIATCYINVCIQQYNNHLQNSSRQIVCELFEGVLKITSLVKLICKSSLNYRPTNSLGLINALPHGEELGSGLYMLCSLLIQHISVQSEIIMSCPANSSSSKEVEELFALHSD
jgi:hypothetical protein